MAQFGRPSSTVTASSFTGGHADIDEAIASDVDRAFSADGNDAELEVGLSALGDPGTDSGHVFRYRVAKTDDGTPSGTGNAKTVIARLLQGATVIAADTERTLTGSYQTFARTLTTGEAAAITDYGDLRLEFTTLGGGGNPTNRRGIGISWAELEIPNAVEQHSGAGAISQTSATVATGQKGGRGAGSISSSPAVTASGFDTQPEAHSGAAAISQSSSVVATGRGGKRGAGAISQAHAVTGAVRKGTSGAASGIVQVSSTAATGREGGLAAPSIGQTHAVAGTGRKAASAVASIAQTSSMTATGQKEGGIPARSGTGAISQAIALSASGRKASAGAGAISQAIATSSAGVEGGIAIASIVQAVSATATGRKGGEGSAIIAAPSGITGSARKGGAGSAEIVQLHAIDAVAAPRASGAGVIAQPHAVTAAGTKQALAIGTFELLEEIARILEPPPSLGAYGLHLTISGVDVDTAGDPFVYKPGTLYVWITDDETEEQSPELTRQNFVIRARYVADSLDEEPRQRRRRDVSLTLDEKRKEYLARIEAAMTAQHWTHITGSVDWDAIRSLEGRGFDVVISGYRLLSVA